MGKLFIRFVIILLALGIAALVVSWHFLLIFGSASALDTGLQRGGSYDRAASQLRSALETDIASGTVPSVATTLEATVKTAITPQLVRQLSQPALTQLTNWLRAGSGDVPNLALSTEQLRTAVVAAAQHQAPALDQTELQFELTRIIPASVTLTGDESASGGFDQTITAALCTFKQGYVQLQRILMIEALCCLLLLVSLLLLSLGRRRSLVRRPAIALLLAGGLCALASYPLAAAFRATLLGSAGNTVTAGGAGVLDYALVSLWPWAIGLAVAGLILLTISFVIPKPPETLPNI